MANVRRPRTRMPQQDEHVRVRNFDEVATGYTPQMAVEEAERCLQCKNPTCEAGCPVHVPIKEFIALTAKGDFIGAARKIKEQSALPAICGRVCPQESQCEKTCIMGRRFEPVAVGRLERFVADYERELGEVEIPELAAATGQGVAIVGSGPAGLTAAGDLAKLGYKVTIFEALHAAGGVLMYGIPQFRLPKETVQAEVNYLRQLGVEVVTNVIIGQTITVDELFEEGYDAVFLGTGAGLPKFMGIPGENLNGVFSANEFLTRINLMKAYCFPSCPTPVKVGQKVAVIASRRIGAVTTGNTTAKLSLLQGTHLQQIAARASRGALEAYVEANREGQSWMLRYAAEHGIEIEHRDAFSYAGTPGGRDTVEREHDVARSLGLPVSLTDATELPFTTHGAVVLPDQAQFDPLDVLAALAADFRSRGGVIIENLPVTGMRAPSRSSLGPGSTDYA
ncbi:MAG: FAD-dependent oxidoreductase, partial [Actinobacteria bacterium]|nr:FAD-dependent oxidoreductase [Actinomycetota bacterium]